MRNKDLLSKQLFCISYSVLAVVIMLYIISLALIYLLTGRLPFDHLLPPIPTSNTLYTPVTNRKSDVFFWSF